MKMILIPALPQYYQIPRAFEELDTAGITDGDVTGVSEQPSLAAGLKSKGLGKIPCILNWKQKFFAFLFSAKD